MEFQDAALIHLADESTRAALFDQAALQSLVAAGYDAPELEGPFGAVFDTVDLSVDLSPRVQVRGTVRRPDGSAPYEVDLLVAGLPEAPPAVTAVWRGAVTARFRPAGEPVTAVASRWSPRDGERFDGGLGVTFAPPAPSPALARRLPVTAVVLARGAAVSVTALLRESVLVRQRLLDAGLEAPADPHLRRRHAIVVAWLLPASVFDDDAWPAPAGADPAALPAARRAAAALWLARSGIALVPTSFG